MEKMSMNHRRWTIGSLITSSIIVVAFLEATPSPAAADAPTLLTPSQLGITVSPPNPEFDPLAATSNWDLMMNGYPARPSDPAALAQWTSLVANPSSFVSPEFELTNTHSSPPEGQQSTASTSCTNSDYQYEGQHWAGNSTDSGPTLPYGYTYASMIWNLPWYTGDGSTNTYQAIWPGLGSGTWADQLVQAGSEQDYVNGSFPSYYWIEVYPEFGFYEIANMQARQNDLVDVEVAVASGTSALNEALFVISDLTTGQSSGLMSMSFTGSSGSQADYIVEAPVTSGVVYPLTHFAVATLSDTKFIRADGTSGTPGSVAHVSYYLDDSSGLREATPQAWTDAACSTFPVIRSGND